MSQLNVFLDKENWDKEIDFLKKDVSVVKDEINVITERFVNAVKDSLPDEKFAILFSGGIDSTLIAFVAKNLGRDFVCYSFGLENAQDLLWSRKIASRLGFELKEVVLDLDEFEKELVETIKLINEEDAIKISVASVFYPILKIVKEKYVFSGLGSEEIFAGYERHAGAKDVNEECWNGLYTIYERDITRDRLLAQKFGLELKLPFLDKDLIKSAMGVDSGMKIKDDYKKYILRLVASGLGLPKEFCWRKKKAAQYGSKANKAFLQIAKRNGFKTRKEFVKSILI